MFRYGARDNDWETYSYELQPDVTYQIRWYYHKDVSDNGVGDYFALDNIQIRPKTQRGDVNGDGQVNITDVTVLISMVLTGSTPTTAADVNGDGQVNITDVTVLISMVLSNG